MEAFIQCDNCTLEFNHYDRIAKMFPKCGHTVCNKCVLTQKEVTGPDNCQCPSCGQTQELSNYD